MILDGSSIDAYVANGVAYAAEYLGIEVNGDFTRACSGPGDKTKALEDFISKGYPFAYLVFTVTDSFKNGFPKNRLAPYLFQRQAPADVLKLAELASDRNTLLQDVADFLLLSMSVNPNFMGSFRDYSLNDLEFKASRYYGQVSENCEDEGLAQALGQLAVEFEKYLVIMKRFSHECLNQEVIDSAVFQQREIRLRQGAYNDMLDNFLTEFSAYSALTKDGIPEQDRPFVNKMIKNLNKKAQMLKKLNPEFKYEPI
ncbi:hypothetical protein KY316_03445, partial [Candidatus Woesearchaeota archaeon]|nr:hypothetical protein [Candidatus Woesearchaeota archaeon]